MKKDIFANITVEKVDCPAWLWLSGAAAGFVNGLLGAGAGIVLVYTFSALSKRDSKRDSKKASKKSPRKENGKENGKESGIESGKNDSQNSVKDNFAMTISTVLPISLLSAFTYFKNTDADVRMSFVFLIPGIIGGLIGAFVTDKISKTALKLIFAAVTVISGASMILR